jgi:hypothetical protein
LIGALAPDGAPIAITGLWDLEFGDGTPDSGKTNQLFFDAGPNAPGVSGYGLFGVIRAAGDQGGNGGGDPVREVAAPSQPVQQTLTGRQLQPVVQQALADWQSAGVTAAQYGFTVLGDGVGTATFNVGSNGDAFGVSSNSTMTVLDLLLATNEQAMGGWLYRGDATRRSHANNVYSALNQAGGIA